MTSNSTSRLEPEPTNNALSAPRPSDTPPSDAPLLREEDRFADPIFQINTTVFHSNNTPRKVKAPSTVAVSTENKNGVVERVNKETHKRIDQVVIGELADAMLIIEAIIKSSLPDTEIHFNPSGLFKYLCRGKKRLFKDNSWVGFEETKTSPSEPKTRKFFENILRRAKNYLAKNGDPQQLWFYSDAFYNTAVRDDDCDLKPDIVMTKERITKKAKEQRKLPTWRGFGVIFEIKKEIEYALQGHRQIAGYVRAMFKEQPNRRSVISVLLTGDEMTFCVFDRSGKVSALPFNIHEQPELFLRVIVGLCYADNETIGFDQTINLEGPKEDWTVEVKGTKYPIENVVYTEGVIRGRGTACYQVRLKDKSFALVKDNWVDMSRDEKEVETLDNIKDIDHHQHVPKVIQHEVVQFRGQDDTTARIRESLLREVLVDGEDGEKAWEWLEEQFKHMELRRHERILLTPFGKKLEEFRSLEELLNAIKHIALGEHVLPYA